MKYFELKGLNNKVSRIILGTAFKKMMSGENVDDILDAAVESGINTIDAARVYGMSEAVLGKWMAERQNRSNLNIITKGCHHDENGRRVNREALFEDIETSLRLLQTDYIDIYMLHRDDDTKPVDSIIEALNELAAAGKILSFGASNWTHNRIEAANEYAYAHGLAGFAVSSPCFSAVSQQWDLWGDGVDISGKKGIAAREWYKENNIPVIAYSSLARGYLSGKYKTYENKPLSEILGEDTAAEYDCEENKSILRKMEQYSELSGYTVPQIALAWVINQPMLSCALVSSSSVENIKSCAKAADIVLPDYINNIF